MKDILRRVLQFLGIKREFSRIDFSVKQAFKNVHKYSYEHSFTCNKDSDLYKEAKLVYMNLKELIANLAVKQDLMLLEDYINMYRVVSEAISYVNNIVDLKLQDSSVNILKDICFFLDTKIVTNIDLVAQITRELINKQSSPLVFVKNKWKKSNRLHEVLFKKLSNKKNGESHEKAAKLLLDISNSLIKHSCLAAIDELVLQSIYDINIKNSLLVNDDWSLNDTGIATYNEIVIAKNRVLSSIAKAINNGSKQSFYHFTYIAKQAVDLFEELSLLILSDSYQNIDQGILKEFKSLAESISEEWVKILK